MKITRCRKEESDDIDPAEWEALVDVPVVAPPKASEGVCVSWERWYGDPDDTGHVEVVVDRPPPGGGEEYVYTVSLRGREFGALLGMMPEAAATEAVRELLRSASPRVIGAIVGGILAHVTEATLRLATD